jgi:hypothetical protein
VRESKSTEDHLGRECWGLPVVLCDRLMRVIILFAVGPDSAVLLSCRCLQCYDTCGCYQLSLFRLGIFHFCLKLYVHVGKR